MADNKLELVVTVEVDKANQSIKNVNASDLQVLKCRMDCLHYF